MRLAISMGDPLGIGPEIICKALHTNDLPSTIRVRLHGSSVAMLAAAERSRTSVLWSEGAHVTDAQIELITDPICDDWLRAPRMAPPGPTAEGGAASFRFIEAAIRDAQRDPADPLFCDAVVTAPISKTSWSLAGITRYPGHTELLSERFSAPHSGMLFVGPSLRVMLASIHIPLARVASTLSIASILSAIELAHQACVDEGIARPRIAVCGINPHAGEAGILGDDESRLVIPAIEAAKAKGIDASGPHPGDTVFNAAVKAPRGPGLYDCVVAMYHDQGLIPIKLLDGKLAVNVTVGLPTIRTSPAHGTAFDIAGGVSGETPAIADPASMIAAIEHAIRLVNARRTRQA